MKNQNFGDSNDFLKFVILRSLIAGGSLRLGINWMRTADVEGATCNRSYLEDNDKWKKIDPDLYLALQGMLNAGKAPRMAMIETSGLLPRTQFFSKVVFDGFRERNAWSEEMLGAMKGSDLVFLDPDHGIEIPSKIPGSKNSSKYILWSEIERLWTQGSSLLIQQHFPREDRDLFIARIAAEVKARTKGADVLLFKTSQVLFLLVIQTRHQAPIRRALSTHTTRWGTRITCL